MLRVSNIFASYTTTTTFEKAVSNKKCVLENISFSIPRGKALAIIGKSGCGKSTLLHILAGVQMPDSGTVVFSSQDITGISGVASFMQQQDLLLPHLKIVDNVALPLRIGHVKKHAARAEAIKLLTQFSLESVATDYPSQLSGGMRQRVALMRACIASSHILLLDEPFSRLDAITKEECEQWCQTVWRSFGATVVLVTHDISEALRFADYIMVLAPPVAATQRGAPQASTVRLFDNTQTITQKAEQQEPGISATTKYIMGFL